MGLKCRADFVKQAIRLELKSDHSGIEIRIIDATYEDIKRLKSDHNGIEIITGYALNVARKQLKSDHSGIEIR
ncbi:unnamed protein product [marine sediment metagenome]|uniref:Uncharacterized protein n=1 Tax=marine sediment metagenome TaxID=412755 RepID=X1M7E9_9ZZZZ